LDGGSGDEGSGDGWDRDGREYRDDRGIALDDGSNGGDRGGLDDGSGDRSGNGSSNEDGSGNLLSRVDDCSANNLQSGQRVDFVVQSEAT
jgi:hypothetical protein